MGDIDINVQKAIQDITRGFSGFTKDNIAKAASSAINRAVSSARVAGTKQIMNEYNIKDDTLRERTPKRKSNAVVLWKASRGSLTGKILAYGGPMPIIDFPTKESSNGISITVKKGKAKNIRDAFYTLSRKGSIKVKARGRYANGMFAFTQKDRLITQLMTTSVRSVYGKPEVFTKMSEQANKVFSQQFTNNLKRMIT